MAIGVGMGAFSTGIVMDRMSSTRRKLQMLLFVYVCLICCMTSLTFVKSIVGAIAFALVYGISAGSLQSLMFPMYATLFGLANLGKIQSIGVALSIISSGCGPLLFGFVHDKSGRYSPAIYAVAAATLVSTCGIAAVLCRQDNKKMAYRRIDTVNNT